LQRKEDNLENSLMEAGVDSEPINYYNDTAGADFKEPDISPIKKKSKKKKDTYITADERPAYNVMMKRIEERALADYEARTNPLSGAAITKRGRPLGSKNKNVTPTNMKTRSSKYTEGFV
jgi:hypothetical protein